MQLTKACLLASAAGLAAAAPNPLRRDPQAAVNAPVPVSSILPSVEASGASKRSVMVPGVPIDPGQVSNSCGTGPASNLGFCPVIPKRDDADEADDVADRIVAEAQKKAFEATKAAQAAVKVFEDAINHNNGTARARDAIAEAKKAADQAKHVAQDAADAARDAVQDGQGEEAKRQAPATPLCDEQCLADKINNPPPYSIHGPILNQRQPEPVKDSQGEKAKRQQSNPLEPAVPLPFEG